MAKRIKVTYSGREYSSLSELARILNLNPSTAIDRHRKGWSIEKILEPVTKDRSEKVTINGVTRSIKKWYSKAGISRSTFYDRRSKGLPESEWIKPSQYQKGLTAFDQTKSYTDWARERKMLRSTLWRRVNETGLTPEMALTLPVAKRGATK